MYKRIIVKVSALLRDDVFKNSSWGVISQGLQTIFISLFFVIVARHYSTKVFADYIIASAMYQLVTAFSSFGLGQWFVREIAEVADRKGFINKFLKIQIYFGILFYFVNILLAYLLYDSHAVQVLIIIFGANIVFDNIIAVIRQLNVADFEQRKSFILLTIEAFLKLSVAGILFITPIPIETFTFILILVRIVTLNLFLKYGSSSQVNIKSLWHSRVVFSDVLLLLRANWAFVIIGGVAIINWRIGTIIIAKTLTAVDVANYEISFKLFSIAQILPVIVSTTVFPLLIKLYAVGNIVAFRQFYYRAHLYYLLFGLFTYTFVYTFIDELLPLIFGTKYALTGEYAKQMFLAILVFPTVLLQANVLIALKLEKQDMLLNMVALAANLLVCLVGLHFVKSLYVVNYSIFISFLVFHVLQDIMLARRSIISVRHVVRFYGVSAVGIIGFISLTKLVWAPLVFGLCWLGCLFWLIRSGKFSAEATELVAVEA